MCLGFEPSKIHHLRRLVSAALLFVFFLPLTTDAKEIRIGGTGNALGTMRILGDAFAKLHPESRPVVLGSIGSSGALKAVAKGAIEIGLSSRELTAEEARRGLIMIEYARSPTVFAVQDRNNVASITLKQLADIYSGRLSRWPDGTPIRPVMRQPGDDNTRQIKQLSAEIESALLVAEHRPGLIFAANDQEAADKMESIPGSIGVTTIALIRSEARALRALALEGIEPTPEGAASGRYPMVKHFNFVLLKAPSPVAQEFITFVRSPQGRKILEQTGHIVP